jgi:uncharacterized damage-inducible protein DinB
MESCDGCGFVYASVAEPEIGPALRHYGRAVADRLGLGRPGTWSESVRTRLDPEVWSPFEYACHLVDVVRTQQERIGRALVETTPDFPSMGIREPARIAGYASRNLDDTVLEVIETTAALAATFEAMTAEQMQRTGVYHWPVTAERTLTWVGRHTIHELRHHLGDIEDGIAGGERVWPAFAVSEVPSLLSWLEFHRGTLAEKVAGLDTEAMRERSVEPSSLTLLGLVRHLAEVENFWFTEFWFDRENALYVSDDDIDADFDRVDTADADEAVATWKEMCRISRRAVADVRSLDETGARQRESQTVSMRWILTHMIEEYARHNGHADLLRERLDGQTGD